MPRANLRNLACFAASLFAASSLASPAFGQLGHRILHDWTIGFAPAPTAGSGYDPRFRRVGLVEFDGDVDGTYVAWGFGGAMTDWSAPTIAICVACGAGVLLIAGALTLATFNRRAPAKA